MPRWVRITFIAIGLALLVPSVLGYIWASQRAASARDWPQAEGRILSSDVQERFETDTDSDGNRRTTRTLYPVVTYSYVVDGETFRSDAIWLMGQQGYGEVAKAYAVARRFPQGGTVAVYYDPSNPADSALVLEGVPWWIFLIAGMGLIWFAVGLFAFRDRRGISPAPALALAGAGDLAGTRGSDLIAPAATEQGNCRSCRSSLPVSKHYFLEKRRYGGSAEGAASWEASGGVELRWIHLPCPRCGEAEPLNTLRHTWRQKLLMLGILALVAGFFALIVWILLFQSDF